MEVIRVVIADDHKIFREGLMSFFLKHPFIKTIGEAGNGKELIQVVRELMPDIVLVDVLMPVMDGIEATRSINSEFPDLGVIVLTGVESMTLLQDITLAGARGCIHKNADGAELLRAMRVVFEGGSYFSRPLTLKLMELATDPSYHPFSEARKIRFTERELGVIRLICEQLSSKEIGARLNLNRRSVEGHRERIQKKIGARNMVGVVIYAIRNKLYPLEG